MYTPGVLGAVKRPLALTAFSWEDQVMSPGRVSMGYQPVSTAETVHWVDAPGRSVRLLGVTYSVPGWPVGRRLDSRKMALVTDRGLPSEGLLMMEEEP